MRIVMLAARKRNAVEDQILVPKIVDHLLEKYPAAMFVSGSCDRGVGKILKNMCLPETAQGKSFAKFVFFENHIRPYLPQDHPELTQKELAECFYARNAFFNEFGEEFHLFCDRDGPKGMILDLYSRVRLRGAPVVIYKPGETESKDAVFPKTVLSMPVGPTL